MAEFDYKKAREFLENREKDRINRNAFLCKKAAADAERIITVIRTEFHPRRIYQWGSLVNTAAFTEISDIDIAVEGITEAAVFFHLLGRAMDMTEFPLDLVQLEKVEPEFRHEIETNGKLIYEN
jgi:predicted nucleotidyltransferase